MVWSKLEWEDFKPGGHHDRFKEVVMAGLVGMVAAAVSMMVRESPRPNEEISIKCLDINVNWQPKELYGTSVVWH